MCCWGQAAGEGGKAKGQDKALRKEAGRLTKLQEDLERIEARCGAQQQVILCHKKQRACISQMML